MDLKFARFVRNFIIDYSAGRYANPLGVSDIIEDVSR